MCKDNDQMACVESTRVDDGSCLHNCEGHYVTAYEKSEINPEDFSDIENKFIEAYKHFANEHNIEVPYIFKGVLRNICNMQVKIKECLI